MRTVYLVLKCFKKKGWLPFLNTLLLLIWINMKKKNEPAVFRFGSSFS